MNKLVLSSVCFILFTGSILAQANYETIESRFTKKVLSRNDSSAFERSAYEKINQLIAFSKLYVDSNSTAATKRTLAKKGRAMFRTNTQTGLVEKIDIDSLYVRLASILESTSYGEYENLIEWKKGSENFGSYIIGKQELEIKVLLLKFSKNFGRDEEQIWQIYFSEPRFN